MKTYGTKNLVMGSAEWKRYQKELLPVVVARDKALTSLIAEREKSKRGNTSDNWYSWITARDSLLFAFDEKIKAIEDSWGNPANARMQELVELENKRFEGEI